MNYHAHIYWRNSKEQQRALDLRDSFKRIRCKVGEIVDRPIGPHPLPMYQVNFDQSQKHTVEFLLNHAGSLTSLIHQDTGDELLDHTTGAIWVGDPLELDLEWLKLYQEQKENKMESKNLEENKKVVACGCGRSPSGNCIGWHSLTEQEYQQRLAEYEADQAAQGE